MIIAKNKETEMFCRRVNENILHSIELGDLSSSIISTIISKENEKFILRDFKKLIPNFKGLKRNASKINKNPYVKNISLEHIVCNDIHFFNNVLPARTVLNIDYMTVVSSCCASSIDLGYYDKNITIPTLIENDDIWMSITEMEIETARDAIEKSSGNVLTFGLGLGYFTYMTSIKNTVESITVIEKNPRVISIFKEYILPQFEFKDKITIIEGDMYDYLSNEFLSKFDYTFADIWKNNEDGLFHYRKIISLVDDLTNFDFWIETGILNDIQMQMALYLKSQLTGEYLHMIDNFTGDMKTDFRRIHKYFSSLDITISTLDELDFYIRDIETIREILKTEV